jgi:hypothetical protein
MQEVVARCGERAMKIPVLMERLEGQHYRARAGEPFGGLCAEGGSQDDALRK